MNYEKIFEYDLDITGVTDYGADMEALFTGREHVPPQVLSSTLHLREPSKVASPAPCAALTSICPGADLTDTEHMRSRRRV
ncbi:MAG TPA: hypothetical protein VFA39_11080 [Steroidobacteraceae bacterium]|nr:hypothetical protein [Steroidobacteraceae bacterium]